MKLSAIIAIIFAISILYAGYHVAGMLETIETQQRIISSLKEENHQLSMLLVEARMGGWPHQVVETQDASSKE